MKYLVILGDGMADYPLDELGGKTPLMIANTPNMDALAQKSSLGFVKTVPHGFEPGSDVANLSILGYAPKQYYTGRSPLEAINMGVSLNPRDVAIRCNFVTLSNEKNYHDRTLIDYCADEITTSESALLIQALNESLEDSGTHFYLGTAYRHCLVLKNGPLNLDLTPPHNITGLEIMNYLPKGENTNKILDFMMKSTEILKNHPVNRSREERGLNPANAIWLWGEGSAPKLPSFKEKFGLKGSMISAVDLLKGIAKSIGLRVPEVDGATGNIHTNFEGKARKALEEFKSGQDFVYLHIEAPDECGHRGEVQGKIKSIELIDQKVLGTLLPEMHQFDSYKILLLPDHYTPLVLRKHTSDPVPYLIFDNQQKIHSKETCFHEKMKTNPENNISVGSGLLSIFLDSPF